MKDTRTLLVEADNGFAKLISSYLNRMEITSVEIAPDFKRGWDRFLKFSPNICLLDVSSGKNDTDGIDFAQRIRSKRPEVKFIFITPHFTEENYQKAKAVSPASFMNKEVSFLKLRQAVELAVTQRQEDRTLFSATAASPKVLSQAKGNQFFFRIGDVYKAIAVDEVSFFYAENKMTYARIGKRNYPTNVQLKVLEENLSPVFIRCHKKYLVNQGWISSINVREDKIELGEESLPIGYTYRKDFLDRLNLLK